MKARRLLVYFVLGLALLGLIAWTMRETISLAVASRVATARLNIDGVSELPDGLHVRVCGAGSPFPDERRLGPCTVVIAGTRLIREYQGVEHSVTVLHDGFEYQGRPYQSLSSIARAITGTRWNGWLFFGLKNRRAAA
jgi:hypothetical protein